MTYDSVLTALEATGFATAIREGSYTFPWLESIHVLAIAMVVGAVFVMDLCLIGVTSHSRSLTKVLHDALPYVWGAFLVAVITGFLMFASSALTYGHNAAFGVKAIALGLAGLNMVVFHGGSLRAASTWDDDHRPHTARIAGVASMACWIVVVGAGRWIGFMA